MPVFRMVFCLGMLTSGLVCGAAVAGWPGFRGPAPVELKAESLPISWSPTEHILWSAELAGTGQSSPVIWEDHVYLTSVEGPNKEECHVLAIDLKSGKQLWQQTVANAFPIKISNMVSKAAPTAVTSAQGVIALFEGGNLLACSHDGTELWARNLVEEYGPVESRHGLSSSLLQSAGKVIVWIERGAEPYILAINPETGENIWKVEGLGVTSWSTPVVLQVDGKEHLVFSGSGVMRGIDPETGAVLWNLSGLTGNSTPSPSAVGEGLLLTGATEARGEGGSGRPADSNGLIRVSKDESGEYAASFVWRAKRATSSFGSPIVHQGLAYFVNRAGIIFCLDLQTGEEFYAERSPESCWATPLGVDDRIYFVGQRGTTTVIKSGKSFEKLAENHLWEKKVEDGPPSMGEGQVQYAVAAVPGCLLIRTGEKVFCLGQP